MARQAETRIHGDGHGRHTLYLPSALVRDSTFPLKVGEALVAAIEGDCIVIRRKAKKGAKT